MKSLIVFFSWLLQQIFLYNAALPRPSNEYADRPHSLYKRSILKFNLNSVNITSIRSKPNYPHDGFIYTRDKLSAKRLISFWRGKKNCRMFCTFTCIY
ncbi:hypothetical protein HZS_2940 [Henneguya salminicola]|nr:hypothetical protein HZS_2940 [Henneguya salminicola]